MARTDGRGLGADWKGRECGKLFAYPAARYLRDYFTRDEVTALLRAGKKSPRHGARKHALILIAYRHGLRASELVNLRVSHLDLAPGTSYCRRISNVPLSIRGRL